MASVPWQDLIDEFRLLRRDLAQTTAAHEQRMERHETEMQVLQTLHEQRMDAMQAQHEEHMRRLDEIAGNHAERLAKAEDTLERITAIWNRLNNPESNGH